MSHDARLRLAITEDHAPTRQVLHANLCAFADVEVVASAGSGEALILALGTLPPDRLPHVVLMDVELPGLSGIETTVLVKTRYPGIDVLMLTVFDTEDVIFQAIRAGASGYLLKDEQPEVLREACLDLVQGGAPMSASIARKTLGLLRHADARPPVHTPDPLDLLLSEREREILEGLVHGASYGQLAEQLHLSPHTVRTHIKNIYQKLHVHSRAEVVRMALNRRK